MKKLGLLVSALFILAGVASAQTTIFSDNMTNLTGWTLSPTTGGWTTTSTKYYSSSYSARCDDVSPYANSQNNYMTKSVSLSGYTDVALKFYIWQYSESGYDYLRVQYLSGTTWTTAWQRAGSYQSWAQQTVSIPNTATQIRFYFNSDGSVTNTGVYIDDVALTGTGSVTQNDAGSGGDAGNDFSTALTVSPGSWTGCYLDGTDRNDYYKFNVTSGQVIKVKITPPSSADFDLYLYNPSQSQKASSTAGSGIVDSCVFTADASGYWYARAYQYSGSGYYSLQISVSGGTAPNLAVSATSWSPAASGGTSSAVNVTNSTTSDVISYTVSSDQSWLTVSSSSGNTPGSFTMTAANNTGGARSATVTVTATAPSGTTGSPKTISVSQAAASTMEWTIMVYLNADNDLEQYGLDDFIEMSNASYSSGKVNLIVQMDRASGYATGYDNWTSCKRFKIANGMTPTAAYQISDIGEVDMGNPQTLADFAKWAIQNYPANKYSLVMWDHGDGWYKSDDGSPIFKGFSNDNSHGSVIDISNGEIANALSQIKTYLGRNLDHVGWDACLMGMWEVLDIAKGYANVANVSEEVEGAAGWYYTNFLNNLNTTPTMSAIDMGKAIINGTSGQQTLSVVDLAQIPNLTAKVNAFADSLMKARGAGYSSAIGSAMTNTLKFSSSYFQYHIDLVDFCRKICAQTVPAGLKNAAANCTTAVQNAVKLYKNNSTYANARGIAIYHCKIDGSNYDSKYNNLPIASSTVWDEYIKGGSSGGATANYTKSTATYSWDASATTATGLTGDDQSVNKSIGFTFNYYGTNYTTVNICSNGFLNFGTTSTAYSPAAIPNTAAPNALIAGLWRDLNVSGGGTITYYSSATKFVVSFNAVKNYSNTSTQTFQMILTPDGKIKIQWGGITTETYASGVENQAGTLGVAATAATNSAALFTPPAAWSSPINDNELETRLNSQGMPLSNLLFQNAPNPVRYKTLIAFQLEKPGEVSLKIYNLNGQLVRTLASGQHNSGYHQVMWDAKDDAGRKVAHGVYIYKLASGEFNSARKMVLVK
ncbi:MAG: pre-peptidase C-terminal domain-containing protein [Candidatus Edwardsbacteria bacterium]|nr:pre-peptidase C-terminal domain-containing protein [Candidatus Edwardsbacteria bacterium]MBU1576479.1 pre-peptidase C-terminal domain-containing protein [Candidatus Edwardsbacteria bacterium]MBU2464462.1 pre-peptidase C-terminal domain-containing protein [Candidatus Edwardsbacteria bacterium]MBU2594552.1 pre-peptidase C-terminal domain-containing protein [Candidatus Edwardsbacteria bacterium]